QPQSNPPAGNVTVNTYSGAALHEQDLASPQKFGKLWWGEEFSGAPGKQTSHTVTLDIGDVNDSVQFNVHLVNTSTALGLFNVTVNGQQLGNVDIAGTGNNEYAKAMGHEIMAKIPFSSGTASIRIDYSTSVNDGSGWLDYVRVNMRKPLSINGNTLLFCDLNSVGTGNIANYQLANANSATQVWDVTDPQNPVSMNGSLQGNTYHFTQSAEELHWFVAMNNVNMDIPEYVGVIPNQNLYGSGAVDYIIVTYPDFKPAAEKIANFHRQRSSMRVMVATTDQVYNEFSSGGQDISAIRDLARMFYERAGMNEAEMPKYLLLMGDASYDYKDRVSGNTNFVPTFEARESFNFLGTYSN
ncbi:MAG TPA: C25 family cysteine peptidase, partial [Chitinophagaceae bacterium]|nr:C25 family cysteine peptidase [Chitinophagaceae bacterium]